MLNCLTCAVKADLLSLFLCSDGEPGFLTTARLNVCSEQCNTAEVLKTIPAVSIVFKADL